MSEPNGQDTGRLNRLLLHRVEQAKAWEKAESLRWRHATDRERAEAFHQLAGLAQVIVRSRGFGLERRSLDFPRLGHGGR